MIPILFEKGETSFASNGIGRLTECLSCEVTQARNDVYELALTYPMTGRHYADIMQGIEDNNGQYGRIVYATHDASKTPQPFDLYKHTAPMNGVVTFYARHVSYRLTKQVLKPFEAFDAGTAFSRIAQNIIGGTEFTFTTDKTIVAHLDMTEPRTVRAQLGGVQGSMLDVYNGGDYEFDHFSVKLWGHLGTDTGVQIRYGKNLTDISQDYDTGDLYNAIVPYWKDEETGTVTMLTNGIVSKAQELGQEQRAVSMDFTTEFETQPTEQQLYDRTMLYLTKNTPWIPKENIKVQFELWREEAAQLQTVKLLDTVDVIYPKLGLYAVKRRVIKCIYDTLREKYKSMELGEPAKSITQAIADSVQGQVLRVVPTRKEVQEAMDAATRQITGFKDSHIRFLYDTDGGLQEIVILDTEDIETAQNVWRMNSGGFGHSSNGYDGPYTLAMTQDGKIVADAIQTGILTDAQGKSYWNMLTGAMNIVGTFSTQSTTTLGNTYTLSVYDGLLVLKLKQGSSPESVIGSLRWGSESTHGSIDNGFKVIGNNGLILTGSAHSINIDSDGIHIDGNIYVANSGGQEFTGESGQLVFEDNDGYEHRIEVVNGLITTML